MGPGAHGQVAGHDRGSHIGVVQVLGQAIQGEVVVSSDVDVGHVRDAHPRPFPHLSGASGKP